MNGKFFSAFVLGCLIPFSCFALKKWDFQIWNYDSVSGALTPRVDLYADVEFRFKDNATTFYYNHEHLEFMIRALPYLLVSPCYRQVWILNAEKKWVGSSEPNVNITFHGDQHGFRFYNRSRATYRIFYDNAPSVWQYRNKFGISKVFWRRPTEVALFVDDEFFLQQKEHGIYENRFSAGTSIKIFRFLALETAYRYRIFRTSAFWEHNNILMLNLRGSF